MLGGYYGLSPTAGRPPPFIGFVSFLPFVLIAMGVAPSFGRPQTRRVLSRGGSKNKTIDVEEREGGPSLPISLPIYLDFIDRAADITHRLKKARNRENFSRWRPECLMCN